MALSETEIEAIYDRSFPRKLNDALVRLIFGAYKTSYGYCNSTFPELPARSLYPFHRWTQIRSELLGIPERFPGIVATSERFYTLLTAGDIILTAHSSEASGELPRESEYRRQYACTSQLDMWDDANDQYIYAILAHGPDHSQPRQPGFIDILFPSKDYAGVTHSIRLFDRFQALVSELRIPNVEETTGQPVIKAKNIRQQNEEAN